MNKEKFDCAVFNFWASNNYGGLLTCYALCETIKKLNYKPLVVKLYKPQTDRIDNFAKKYLNVTEKTYNQVNIAELNKFVETFIVGSDCVFAPEFYIKSFLLDFVNGDKKKISYAPSFGQKFFNGSYNLKNIFNYYLEKFDFLSVRELSGVDLCKKEFNLNATQVMDPVFLLDKNDYINLIETKDENDTNDVSHYLFKPDEYTDVMLQELEQNFGNNVCNINMKVSDISLSQWLSNIKNSKFLLTQSFHGACFAIIFNIPFVFAGRESFDTGRIESVLEILGLQNRIIDYNGTFDSRPDLFEPIDWDRVNSILEKEKERSIKWLKEALEAPKDLSKVNPADAIIQSLNNKIISLEYSNSQKIATEDIFDVLNYKKNYSKYLKNKILKNFVFGKTRTRYKEKQKIYHERVRKVRVLKKRFN